jgi:hypothetical protein
MTMMRYAILIAFAVAGISAVVSTGADQGRRFLVDAGQGGSDPQSLALWLLAGLALITTLSLGRFVVFRIPSMLGSWYQTNRQWLYTLLLGGLIWGVFYFLRGGS